MTEAHRNALRDAILGVVSQETWDNTLGDKQVAAELMKQGVYATKGMVGRIRRKYGIGDCYERKQNKYEEFVNAKARQ